METAPALPLAACPTYMSRYGEAIRERREVVGYKTGTACAEASAKLEREDPAAFKRFSQSSISRWENDKTGDFIEAAHGKSLRTLAYLLNWNSEEFERHVGVPIGRVPRLEDTGERKIFTFLERFGEPTSLTIRIPIYGTVAAGIRGFDRHDEPEEWRRFSPDELPKGIENPEKLFLVGANGTSMYEEGMLRPVPNGSWLLVEADAVPEEGQLVVAYIEERDLGVVKQFKRAEGNAFLRSYQVGGPAFWTQDFPDMRIEGVVRRVSYEP